MALVGRLHPLIVHFPIALILAAAAFEAAGIVTGDRRCRTVAVANLRAGAASAVAAAVAGWGLATAPAMESTAGLGCHRWLGVSGALAATIAAIATLPLEHQPPRHAWLFRAALFAAASCIAATGHSGGLLVWGADFLRP